MAQSTIRNRVLPAQGEDQAVIEGGTLPARRRRTMTALAVCGKPGFLMVRLGRRLVIGKMTTGTIRRGPFVLTIQMA
jgi:hypothetical protein